MTDIQHDIFGGQVEVNREEETKEISLGKKWGEFNIFALTDAVGARHKREAWVLYQKALASGMVAEEIFWKIAWIVKSMLLASRTADYSETDMKEFPYKKAKGYAKNFSPAELENLSESLVLGYHKARRGIGEIETLLEKVILTL
jgi:hypothetical protein